MAREEYIDIELASEDNDNNCKEDSESNRRRTLYAPTSNSESRDDRIKEFIDLAKDVAEDIQDSINNNNDNQNNNNNQPTPEPCGRSSAYSPGTISNSTSLSTKQLGIIIGVILGVIIIIVAITVPVALTQNKQTDLNPEKSTTAQTGTSLSNTGSSSFLTTINATRTTTALITTICRNMSCLINPSIQNPSSNYQIQHIDINCTQSLMNFTIVQVVRHFNNETYAGQYQTFGNQTTNLIYIVTQSDITYMWYMLPNVIINGGTFPYFTEAHYYYGGSSIRGTDVDYWQVSLESICGDIFTSSGTF